MVYVPRVQSNLFATYDNIIRDAVTYLDYTESKKETVMDLLRSRIDRYLYDFSR